MLSGPSLDSFQCSDVSNVLGRPDGRIIFQDWSNISYKDTRVSILTSRVANDLSSKLQCRPTSLTILAKYVKELLRLELTVMPRM